MKKRDFVRRWPPELPYENSIMNSEKALTIIESAKAKGKKMGFNMVFPVCDAGGNLIAFQKMDNAPLVIVEIAINKAITAIIRINC